ncbi:MAG: peptidoglycan DD-metalloendopeptidase family protein [Lachnospiraceae bacterium]|nr:peptidoglycan DD-metalloendopeptidase family protein [Lachnospiraceae bacterium]
MIRRFGRVKFLLVATVLILSIAAGTVRYLPAFYASAENSDPRKAYEEKLKAAQDQKNELEKKKKEQEALIAEFNEEKDSIQKYIEELDLKLNDITLRIFELKKEIERTEAELEETKKDLEAAKQREADKYATMKKRIAYIYENGETSYIEILMNSGSIADFLNQVEYVQDIAKYDNSLLERYKIAKKEVEDREDLLNASLEELNLMRESEETEQSTVNELMALKGQEIDKLTEKLGIAEEYVFVYIDEISNKEVEIDQIIEAEQKRIEEEERKRKEEEERRKREEEEERRKAQEAQTVSKPTSTAEYDADAINHVILTDETNIYKMIWPLPGDHRTYSKFGPRKAPTAGASTYHKGWDIGGEFGAPMVSVLAGTVIAVNYNSSAGNFVKVEHQPGFVTVYCHCSKTLVSEGQYVKQGQQIALVGSTGVSTGPHLHFAIQRDGEYVDPEPYIGFLE